MQFCEVNDIYMAKQGCVSQKHRKLKYIVDTLKPMAYDAFGKHSPVRWNSDSL